MGQIAIKITGSFIPGDVHVQTFSALDGRHIFSALDGGHAAAVAQAIEFLARVVLPRAIELDHELHSQGQQPRKGFGKQK